MRNDEPNRIASVLAAPVEMKGTEPIPPSGMLFRLLHIAEQYRADGALRQAVPIFFELVNQHPQSPEAGRAREALLQIAERYERNGERRQALSLYEQLL